MKFRSEYFIYPIRLRCIIRCFWFSFSSPSISSPSALCCCSSRFENSKELVVPFKLAAQYFKLEQTVERVLSLLAIMIALTFVMKSTY